MSYVWDIPEFKGSDKLVMLCLADHADDDGLCWPSIDTIARKSGVSSTTVKATLKKLETGGWIFKRNQFKKADSGRLVRSNNQYQLPVLLLKKKADEQTDFEQSNFVRSKLEHSKFEQAKQPQGVGQISTGGRAESDHKPSIDPPIEPPVNNPIELETFKSTELAVIDNSANVKNMSAKSLLAELDWTVFGDITQHHANEIIRIRTANLKAKGKKPNITQGVLKLLANQFNIAANNYGVNLDDCLDEWELRGWESFKADWLDEAKTPQRRNNHPDIDFDSTGWGQDL
jgi:DNA-binding transcriptional regulator YhcF (GntR family)